MFIEGKSFKKFVKTSISPGIHVTARSLWKSVLLYGRDEFSNLCLLASLIMSISGLNSSIKCTFSFVSNILSDKHLSMSYNPEIANADNVDSEDECLGGKLMVYNVDDDTSQCENFEHSL